MIKISLNLVEFFPPGLSNLRLNLIPKHIRDMGILLFQWNLLISFNAGLGKVKS